MYACICKSLRESDVRRLARPGQYATEELVTVLGLDDFQCCGLCASEVERFAELLAQEPAARAVHCD